MKKTNEVTTMENTAVETKEVVWILTARTKEKPKQVKNFICKADATQKAVDALKEKKMTFITLTNEDRVRSYLAGDPIKGWATNFNALTSRGVEVAGLYDAVLNYLDCTTEDERWAQGDVIEIVTPDIIPEDL